MIKAKEIQRIISANSNAQDASIEIKKYVEKLVKSNSVLGGVVTCGWLCGCGKKGQYSKNTGKVLCGECFNKTIS